MKILEDNINASLVQEIDQILKALELELKFYKTSLDNLINNKPYCFQKNKLKEYKIKKQTLEDQIQKCQKKIQDKYELYSKITNNK